MLKVEVAWTVVAVLSGLDWLDKAHRLNHQNPPQKLAISSPFQMLKVEVEWTIVAVLYRHGCQDKVECIN